MTGTAIHKTNPVMFYTDFSSNGRGPNDGVPVVWSRKKFYTFSVRPGMHVYVPLAIKSIYFFNFTEPCCIS